VRLVSLIVRIDVPAIISRHCSGYEDPVAHPTQFRDRRDDRLDIIQMLKYILGNRETKRPVTKAS